jgi:hypothetical protein
MCTTQSGGEGGSWQKYPPPRPSDVMPPIDTHSRPCRNPSIEYLVLSGRMVTCVHDPVSGRGANQEYPLPPSAKSGQNTARVHRPHPVYTAMLIIWGLSMSAHIRRMVCVHAQPHWGLKQIPPPTQSAVTPVFHPAPFNESWLNKQADLADHALCLPGRKLTYILLGLKIQIL